jgi:hypothetical protein
MFSWVASVAVLAGLAANHPHASDPAIGAADSVRARTPVAAVTSDSGVAADTADTTHVGASVAPVAARGPVLMSPMEATLARVMASEGGQKALGSEGFGHKDFFAADLDSALADTTQGTRRPRAIEYSEAYHTRLKIHQIGAYLMLPLFISEYIIGQKLLNSTNRSGGLKAAHGAVAAGVGIVFVANTVTGAWNFWDSRKDPNGRTRRDVHSALMLLSDVGFVLTAASGSSANHSLSQARTHRTIAISSIALSAVGSGMMWLWKN